jgi:hypothetical protein
MMAGLSIVHWRQFTKEFSAMMKTTSSLVLGVIGLGLAGTALAAASDLHTMKVAMPDGSVALVQYHGDVAPTVVAVDPFAEMAARMAQMEVQSRAMIAQAQAQAAAMQREAAAHPGQSMTVVSDGKVPSGISTWTSVTTTSNGKGSCTQTVTWRSDSAGKPQMTQASSGDCDAVKRDGPAVPASVTAPVPPKPPVAPVKKPVEVAPPGTYPA